MKKIKTFATSANMGPGFDCAGVCLSLGCDVFFEKTKENIIIECGHKEFNNKDNLIYQSFLKTLDILKKDYSGGLNINIKSNIPLSRGLGSSATIIVSGVIMAFEVLEMPYTKKDIFNIASIIEGHPDNIAPCVFGGITFSLKKQNEFICEKIDLKKDIVFNAIIPDIKLSTSDSRKVLPKSIPFDDAVFNTSHIAILVSKLANGNLKDLKYIIDDKIHQDYRQELIPHFKDIKNMIFDKDILGFYLSGAGPTMIYITEGEKPKIEKEILNFLKEKNRNWEIKNLRIENEGYKVY